MSSILGVRTQRVSSQEIILYCIMYEYDMYYIICIVYMPVKKKSIHNITQDV